MPEAVRLEVPDWVLPRLAARFGAALAAELAALLDPAPLDLRVNLLKATREAAAPRWRPRGSLRCRRRSRPGGCAPRGAALSPAAPAFQSGLVEIQDEGSQLSRALTDARPGMRVVDFCAGAGGKTLALAMTMATAGHIAACDVSAARLEAAVRRLRPRRRAQCRAASDRRRRQMDQAPRGGLRSRAGGRAVHRHRHLAAQPGRPRLRLTESDLAELIRKQAEILDGRRPWFASADVWSTLPAPCSPRRTRLRCTAFLARHAGLCSGPACPRVAVRPTASRAAVARAAVPGDFLSLTPRAARHRRVLRRGAGAGRYDGSQS